MIFEINIKKMIQSQGYLVRENQNEDKNLLILIITDCIMGSELFRLIDLHCN